jgi:hypothetical protein
VLPVIVMMCFTMGLLPITSADASAVDAVIEALANCGVAELELVPLAVIAGAIFFGWRERVGDAHPRGRASDIDRPTLSE